MSGTKLSLADWQQQLGRADSKAETSSADGLVYSTDQGRIKTPATPAEPAKGFADGKLRLKRETKGRNGKAVITIAGITEGPQRLNEIAALLKKKCGCGGAVKDGVVEIQGDNRELIVAELEKLGYSCKWAGG
ncbi:MULTISPECIES: translation initiation factor [Rheinheimera]|uniref:Translation initiation factor n=1 Tax=Rheinheimera marina TaxID=1774958 RepID=A0ABV9JNK2_9GAMM